MAKVTLNTAPSAQVVSKAGAEVVVHDTAGRAIALRKPGVLAQFRLVDVLGDSAKNEVYTRMVLPLLYVASIDGESVTQFGHKSEIEALIQQLDEHGIATVMQGVNEHFGAQDPERDRASLKN